MLEDRLFAWESDFERFWEIFDIKHISELAYITNVRPVCGCSELLPPSELVLSCHESWPVPRCEVTQASGWWWWVSTLPTTATQTSRWWTGTCLQRLTMVVEEVELLEPVYYAGQTPTLSRTECSHSTNQSKWAGLWPEQDLYKLMQYLTAR